VIVFAAVLTAEAPKRVSMTETVSAPVAAVSPAPWPSAVTRAWPPRNASVVLVTTGTAAAAPTLALPDTVRLPAMASRSSCSSAATRMLPLALTVAPSVASGPPSTNASVVMSSTETPALTLTAAEPPPPTPAEIEVIFSLEVASTVILPSALTSARLPIEASVSLVSVSTSTPTPTPAVPPIESAPAAERIVVVSVAASATPWPAAAPALLALTCAPASMCAFVLWCSTSTVTEPATPAVPPPPPATATVSSDSDWVAAMRRPAAPLAPIAAFAPTAASTLVVRTSVALETPTPAVPPKARPPA
jgi:hypothetical protein